VLTNGFGGCWYGLVVADTADPEGVIARHAEMLEVRDRVIVTQTNRIADLERTAADARWRGEGAEIAAHAGGPVATARHPCPGRPCDPPPSTLC